MSSFLDDAVAAFLDSVTERAFDEPLMALLRAEGFTHVVFSHGPSEFGKDMFARKEGQQWAFQSKTGDIKQRDWGELDGQLRILRLSDYAGPAFDSSLSRRPVLVTTGRLRGNAPLLAAEYNEQAKGRGEPELEIWDREELLGRLSGNPGSALRGGIDGPLLSALGEVERGAATMDSIELFSRRWEEYEYARLVGIGVIEAALLCEGLARNERLDLACHLALCLVARAWAADRETDESVLCADAGWGLFDAYAEQLWSRCDDKALRTGGLMEGGITSWAAYPVRCMRVAELMGLFGLRSRLAEDPGSRAGEIAEWVAQLIYRQPGTSHPISDRFAVSMIPPLVLIDSHKSRASKKLLSKTTVWLCDRYEREGLGLAGPSAGPREEVDRLFGVPFEDVPIRGKRRQSLAAAVCLDLSGILAHRKLYNDIWNDFLAARIVPYVLRTGHGLDQYRLTGTGNRYELNPQYPDPFNTEGLMAMAHHQDDEERLLVTMGRSMDLLAVSSALRDRYFCGAIRRLGELSDAA